MYVKVCPDCNKRTYSAGINAYWKCTNCGKDLTDIPVELPIHTTIDKGENTTNKEKK